MPETENRKAHEPQHERLMSQSNAAKALGTSRPTVVARIAAGELHGETVDGVLKVVRASVDAYLARQQDAATVPV